MSEEPLTIADDMLVRVDYVLRSQTGREIGRSDGTISFVQGYGAIVPGLEKALYGMSAGEEKDVVVAPADGYGAYDEEDVQRVPHQAFPEELEVTLGKGLRLRNRESGEEYVGYVVQVEPDYVILDFNHPLAGQTLHFQVRIVDLRQATDAELEQASTNFPESQ